MTGKVLPPLYVQVQRMAMKTLLKRDWSPSMLQQVSVAFFTQVLLPALLSPLHYNTQLAVNPTTTGAVLDPHKQQTGRGSSFDVAQQACQLVASYVVCAGPAAARELFTGGLQAAAAPSLEVSRSGMQAVLRVLAAAGQQCQQQGQGVLHGLTAAEAGKPVGSKLAGNMQQASQQQLKLLIDILLDITDTSRTVSPMT